MIELILTGTVEVHHTNTDSGEDGREPYRVRTSVSTEYDVRGEKEFPDGYVNLEGYVLSKHYSTVNDMLHSFEVFDNPAFDGADNTPKTDTFSVSMHGGKWDWIQQAVNYARERPDRSLIDCLNKFQTWDETKDRKIRAAVREIKGLDHVDDPVGGLDDHDYNVMLNRLQNRAKRSHAGVDIAQYKRDEQTA